MQLRNKIILMLLLISVVPIFVVGFIETQIVHHRLEKQFGADGVDFGNNVLKAIDLYLSTVFQNLHAISHLVTMEEFSLSGGNKKMTRITKSLGHSVGNFSYFVFTDLNGTVVAARDSKLRGKDFSVKPGFAEALAGNANIQQPYYDDIAKRYVMMVSFPILEGTRAHRNRPWEGEEVLGVLMGALKWHKIDAIMKNVRDERLHRDTTSNVVLFNNEGLVLSSDDPDMAFTTNLIDLDMESAKKAVQGEEGYVTEINEHGTKSFIAYTYHDKNRSLARTNLAWTGLTKPTVWNVLIERDPKLVFASVAAMHKTLGYTLAGCVLVLVLVSVVFGERLSKPILALSKTAKAFGGGVLSSRVEVNRSDEIGTLGVSFNLMAAQIEKYSESLEGLVKARTVELEDANAELIVRMDELWQSDEDLRQSEEKYRMLVENVDVGVTLLDVDYNILFVNSAQCKRFGKKPEELIGKKCYLEFKQCETVCEYCPGNLAIKTGKTETAETEDVLEDGTHISVQLMASPLYGHDNKPRGFIEVAEDITEQKRVESELHEYQERLRSLASKLTLSEEHERRRIASGLHDSIIQPLAFINMKLETLLKKEETGDELMASLRRIREETSGLIAMTRGFTFELSYPILYEFGLEAAMEEWLKEKIEGEHDLKTKFSDDGSEKPIDDDMRTFLFGAFRELLVNIIKHANAKKINVAVSGDDDKITIRVEDDGIGFDYSETRLAITKESGFGFFGIRDRLEYLGGNLKIESKVASGTVVTLCAPLRQDL
ncbi:MAG: PAS domain S-box protein [Planctomycetes bacterium]|nr:PAS domain S-box protein [Planctomycetota bacterium]